MKIISQIRQIYMATNFITKFQNLLLQLLKRVKKVEQ